MHIDNALRGVVNWANTKYGVQDPELSPKSGKALGVTAELAPDKPEYEQLLFEEFKELLFKYLKGKKGPIYWRTRPEYSIDMASNVMRIRTRLYCA